MISFCMGTTGGGGGGGSWNSVRIICILHSSCALIYGLSAFCSNCHDLGFILTVAD